MPDVTYTYKVEGLEELVRKVDATTLLAGPLRRFFARATLIVVKFTKLRAPYRTGRLQGGIKNRIDPRPLPLWGQVATRVTSAGFSVQTRGGAFRGPRVSYPTILEMSSLTHYRSPGMGLATHAVGQPTRGWWSGSLADAKAEIGEAMDAMGREVEALWLR